MNRATLLSSARIAVLVTLVAAAVLVPRALMRPLAGANAPNPEAVAVPAIPGCDPDPAALAAIEAAVTATLAKHPLTPAAAGQVWRLHSICRQGDWAYAFVKGYHASTQAPLPSPSELVLAQLVAGSWQALLPEMGQAYNAGLGSAPEALLPAAAKSLLAQPAAAANLRFTDYALPFPAGQSAYVTWHWYWALDFTIGSANGGVGTIRNAKAGVAVFVKDSSTRECGDPPPDWYCWMAANVVVIQSGPNEFAWYLHLAPHSVPDWIVEGAYVPAGADLGQEGATGWTSQPHLHFQVASWYACCDGEGNSRMPHWPLNSLLPVDFVEYAWHAMPSQATSQNGPATDPVVPPAPTPTSPPPEAPPQAPPPDPLPTPLVVSTGPLSTCPNPYIVQRGEWLLKIADQCGVTLAAIVAANPGIRPQLIYAGQALNLPGGTGAAPPPAVTAAAPTAAPTVAAAPSSPCSGTHVVAPGENLFRIAYNCGLTTGQLAAANGIGPPYTIFAGQSLTFP